ncbi:SGNH/GDSL hydrolase family protein [Paenibacillus roseipurpureus]|uniref:SGNH/GDSL hydrolase family protein n=1 Tax=Paenibacillus roseopurpureus TaxID=2918901 RepID=A0AA96LRS1_9BACL|nr:SGNH/GDSL hydrolase family protein [Paenibacillus sp. MBLB1832]WNR46830.1 SGNH/GDSL hydrolase family protein [Paenibacillus sp. MBLB1832]
MIYGQVELHNVAEAIRVPGREGVLLQRVPEDVRIRTREATQMKCREAAGCEIRFVSDWNPVKVTLVSYSGPTRVYYHCGDFAVRSYTVGKEPVTIELTPPTPAFLQSPDFPVTKLSLRFDPKVMRLVSGGGELHLLDVDGVSVRPPKPEELPALRYLAYGTSITQGESATQPDLTYVRQTGWRIGADVMNLGMAGTAYCEPALAEYMASLQDWDIASICASVNMLNQGVSVEDFELAAGNMVQSIASAHPTKPIVCIGIFPSFLDLNYRWPERNPVSTPDEYRTALKRIAGVEAHKGRNVHYVDGRDLLQSMKGLSSDILHPGDHGMIEIGYNLAKFMEPLLARLK